jgi:hypothetical protein
MKKSIIFLAALSVAVLLYGITTTEEFQKTYQLKKGDKINLKNINGSIKINGWENDYVDLQATKKTTKTSGDLDDVEIIIEEKNGLNIETKHHKRNPKVSVSYVLNVPMNVVLDNITSSNGSITIEDAGEVKVVDTSNGAIKVLKCNGTLEAHSSNGSITIDGFDGSAMAYTSNGKIIIENITGLADARSSNGAIQIYNTGGIAGAKTSNGSIKAQINYLTGDTTLKSSNGSISVYLDYDLNADIQASTSNSKIKLHDVSILADDISNSYIHGQIGEGGNLLKLSTSNARINIYDSSYIEK